MLVKGQGLVYPCFARHHERNALHESPCLILMRSVQCKALREQIGGEVHHVHFLCGQELGDDLNGLLLIAPSQGVSDLQEYRVCLTPDQVREYGLPSTPLKDTETRADDWRRAMGVEQTEIDALAALQPDLLRQVARDAIAPFYDRTLDQRVRDSRWEWLTQAQAIVDDSIGHDRIDRLRTEAAEKLSRLRAEIDAINNAVRLEVPDIELPPAVVPLPVVDGRNGTPLLDSRWSFSEQCRRLIAGKAYRGAS